MAERAETGVTAAAGFCAAATDAGIRKTRAADLALIASDRDAAAAAVTTRNRVQAAPLLACREALASSGGRARAVVINAGNANACTGEPGLAAARATASEAARLLGVARDRVLVASTGVIGQPLPLERLLAALPATVAALSPAGGRAAAEAMMTTDTRRKEAVRRVALPGGTVTVGGAAKGSGMIHPDLATTLGFVTTDAALPPEALQRLLRAAVDVSFNRVTVDGDTSTNDMVLVLANGASGLGADAAEPVGRALTEVLVDLAREIARDGEGATRLVTVAVTGGRSDAEALAVARTIAGSPLVKTAVHGHDANWGRVVAAAGRAGVDVDSARMRVAFGGVAVLEQGHVSRFSEEEASAALAAPEVVIGVDLGQGAGRATTWTCDLSADYVRINASYRS